jgi:hypothetical protein
MLVTAERATAVSAWGWSLDATGDVAGFRSSVSAGGPRLPARQGYGMGLGIVIWCFDDEWSLVSPMLEMSAAATGVATLDPAALQLGRERVEVVDRYVDRRHPERAPSNRLAEIDPHPAVRAAPEGHVAMTKAAPDADGRDPAPRALDPPRGNVRDRCPESIPPEADVEVAVESDPRVVRVDPEEGQHGPRAATDADREMNRWHRRIVKELGLERRGARLTHRIFPCQYPTEVLTPGWYDGAVRLVKT